MPVKRMLRVRVDKNEIFICVSDIEFNTEFINRFVIFIALKVIELLQLEVEKS